MERKKFQKLSVAAFAISLLPLSVFIPIFLKIALPSCAQCIWTGFNFASIIISFILSIVCVKNGESRSVINIFSMVLSAFLLMLSACFILLMLYINFVR